VSARSVLTASSALADCAMTGEAALFPTGSPAILEGLASAIYGLPGALLILPLVTGFV
jgi:hypothetical protein